MYVCMYACKHACLYAFMHVCMHASMYSTTGMHLSMYSMHLCLYVYGQRRRRRREWWTGARAAWRRGVGWWVARGEMWAARCADRVQRLARLEGVC